MTYDDSPQSRDIDNLTSKTRDLDYDISRIKDDLQSQIWQLKREVMDLLERIKVLERGQP